MSSGDLASRSQVSPNLVRRLPLHSTTHKKLPESEPKFTFLSQSLTPTQIVLDIAKVLQICLRPKFNITNWAKAPPATPAQLGWLQMLQLAHHCAVQVGHLALVQLLVHWA